MKPLFVFEGLDSLSEDQQHGLYDMLKDAVSAIQLGNLERQAESVERDMVTAGYRPRSRLVSLASALSIAAIDTFSDAKGDTCVKPQDSIGEVAGLLALLYVEMKKGENIAP